MQFCPSFPVLGLEASSFLSHPEEFAPAGTPTPGGPPSLLASTVVHLISKDCPVWPGSVWLILRPEKLQKQCQGSWQIAPGHTPARALSLTPLGLVFLVT